MPDLTISAIVEATGAQTGMPVSVVTDGTTRAECRTKEAADRIRRELEAVP